MKTNNEIKQYNLGVALYNFNLYTEVIKELKTELSKGKNIDKIVAENINLPIFINRSAISLKRILLQ